MPSDVMMYSTTAASKTNNALPTPSPLVVLGPTPLYLSARRHNINMMALQLLCRRALQKNRPCIMSRFFARGFESSNTKDKRLRVVRLDKVGGITHEKVRVEQLITGTFVFCIGGWNLTYAFSNCTHMFSDAKLHVRDFLDLESSGLSKSKTRIVPQRACIVVSLSHIKVSPLKKKLITISYILLCRQS